MTFTDFIKITRWPESPIIGAGRNGKNPHLPPKAPLPHPMETPYGGLHGEPPPVVSFLCSGIRKSGKISCISMLKGKQLSVRTNQRPQRKNIRKFGAFERLKSPDDLLFCLTFE